MAENSANNDETKRKTLKLGGTLQLKKDPTTQAKRGFSVEVKRKKTFDGKQSVYQSRENIPDHLKDLTNDELEARLEVLRKANQGKNSSYPTGQNQVEIIESASKGPIEAPIIEPPIVENNQKKVRVPEKQSPTPRDFIDEEETLAATTKSAGSSKRKTIVYKNEPEAVKSTPVRKGQESQSPRKLDRTTLARVLDDETESRSRSVASMRRMNQKRKRQQDGQAGSLEKQKIIREVIIPETIAVGDLANRMAVRSGDVVKSLIKLGIMATINQIIDADTAELLCDEYGHTPKRVTESDVEIGLSGPMDDPKDLQLRAPVVTVMGHVDHGKTSLLDALRATDVVAGEAGGITQHIGAYQVTVKSGKKITFIDTPGHAAFSEMRARGANITDIVILVVAADDGIMEQTKEAINHAKAAGVTVIIAINKIDKPAADPQRVRSDLLSHDIVLEEFGGDILAVEVSAKEKLNLDILEETILLQAEVIEPKANPNRSALGAVIEAKIDRGRGTVATLLVQNGTLKVGDIVVAGSHWGKIRAMYNDKGKPTDSALPSMPVEVLGFNGVPVAGDEFLCVESEAQAREITESRIERERNRQIKARAQSSMESIMSQIKAGDMTKVPVVIKTDVHGSLEAITNSLAKVGNDEIQALVLHGGVGGINESDVTLAKASNGIILGFNVRANPQAKEHAKKDGVDIRYYSIIYNLIDDMKQVLSGLLAPTIREKQIGNAEIREVFNITGVGKVAGCYIKDGVVKRGAKVRLLRDSVVIHEGTLKTLKRFKEEVKEVKESFECGMAFENYNDIRKGDIIECSEIEEIARSL